MSGDFAGARGALETCEHASGLTRAELAAYHEAWALVWFGEGDDEEGARALARLAAVEPEHRLTADAPPRIRARFQELLAATATPTLELRAERERGDAVVSARVRDDPHGVVERTRIFAREGERGEWRSVAGEQLSLTTEGDVAYYGVAEGVGGAPVAAAGSVEDPLWLRSVPDAAVAQADDLPIVLGVVAATAIVVGLAVGLGVGLGTQQQGATISAPMPQGFIHF